MARFLSPPPKFQYVDADGNPLSGGKLYTYDAGTSTPKDTYINETGTLNANPIILGVDGTATIYLTQGTPYKFILKTSADVQLWSQDNIEVPAGGGGSDGGFGVFLDLGSGTSFTCDWSLATWFRISPTNNFSVAFSNTPAALEEKTIIIEVVGADGFNVTLPAGGSWGALGEPEFSPNTDLVSVGMRNGESTSLWMLAHPGEL